MRFFASILTLLCPICLGANEPVFIGQFPSKVVPKQVELLTIPERSIISELAAEGACEKDAVIARLNADKIAEAKEELEMKVLRDRVTRTDALRDLEKKKRELNFYLSLTKKEREFEASVYKSDDLPPEQALEDLDMRIDLAKKELERSERTLRKDFEEKEKKSILRMPFKGRIQYHIVLPDDTSVPFECSPVQQFATLCDDEDFYITIGIGQPDLTQLPAEQFSVIVKLPAGKELTGTYEFRRVERNGSADMLVYFFRVPVEDHETAFSMLGTQGQARLYYQSKSEVKRLNKAELTADPRAENVEDWQELIKLIYPDYNILIEADKDILIIPQGQEP
ncbi:MAG: hypothetical protein R3Y56_05730 [Akkermansia sp.]